MCIVVQDYAHVNEVAALHGWQKSLSFWLPAASSEILVTLVDIVREKIIKEV